MNTALLSTATGSTGSMVRYALLLREALATQGIQPELVELARPRRLPGPLGTWEHHTGVRRRTRALSSGGTWDLLHVMDGSHAHIVPDRLPPVLVTVHDLIPLLQTRGILGGPPVRAGARRIILQSLEGLRRARLLVAVSEATRLDLLEHTDVDEERIKVIYSPLASDWGDPSPRVPVPNRILHIGNDAFYKNREGVLRIFKRACALHGGPLELVLAGAPAGTAIRRLEVELGLEGRILHVPHPDDRRLKALYRESALLLFPSRYEGFGWPPLEAMALGVPVVCSNAASLPEVVGEAALTAAPDAEEELAAHVVTLLEDPVRAARAVEAGRVQAARFTIDRTGSELAAVYRETLA